MDPKMTIIGANEFVKVGNENVPAKIDTGADASAIWASNFSITENHQLQFTLFDEDSEYYTGDLITTSEYDVVAVRSSNGETSVRYRTDLSIEIGGRKINVKFNLSDRSRNQYPILIGRRTIKNRFYVDPKREAAPLPRIRCQHRIKKELTEDPHLFHQKYMDGLAGKETKPELTINDIKKGDSHEDRNSL